MLNYAALFAKLQAINYAGNLSLEPHINGEIDTIRNCKTAVENLWEQAETENSKRK